MCGRFGFLPDNDRWYERFEITNKLDIEPHYNIVPSMMVPVITKTSPKKATLMRWGFIPQWARDLSKIKPQINARADGIEAKPFFRISFKSYRCLVPSSHFFEWKRFEDDKIPYCIKLKGKDMFTIAGIYSEIKDAEGYPIRTFALITTEPNKLMEKIHNRMPVILDEKFEDRWLDEKTDVKELLNLLKPFDDEKMEAYPISKSVNNPGNDSSEVIKPA